ncbi:unnamed protein product [Discosporangium mesarthrocarpum]
MVLNAITAEGLDENPVARSLLEQAPPQMDPQDPRGLSLPPIELCRRWQRSFCPLEERFFSSEQELIQHYLDDLGFVPRPVPLEQLNPSILQALSSQMEDVLPGLMPSSGFANIREGVRAKLEQFLLREVDLPTGSTLRIFGSSASGFGNDTSDLDMCIVYPPKATLPQNYGDLIEGIAERLTGNGMLEVDCRSTARIPIVMFKDPSTSLKCDISVVNPLAVRNTQLLKVYSEADPRVKALAYVVKNWAKRRRINNASEGTLSSYGYLLCLLHFLQTRNPPVVPNLQALPPDWTGQPMPLGPPSRHLPRHDVLQPVDGHYYNTYFFDPMASGEHRSQGASALRAFCSRNKETLGSLLAGFFRYYGHELDSRKHIVSVRLGDVADRERKAEESCWGLHTRLSIEDPFETWYDVAHVLKWSRYKHVHTEFMRAYSVLVNTTRADDILPTLWEEVGSPFNKNEERASQEAAEEEAERLRLVDLEAHAL